MILGIPYQILCLLWWVI